MKEAFYLGVILKTERWRVHVCFTKFCCEVDGYGCLGTLKV